MWVAAGNPAHVREGGADGPRRAVLHDRLARRRSQPLIEIYKKEIDNAEPVGDYVNDNVMVTSQMLCLEDGQRARDIACNMTTGYQSSLVFHYLDTFPKPPGIPEWPELIPEPTPQGLEHQHRAGPRGHRRRPTSARARCRAYADVGADQLIFGMLSTTMPVEVAIEAIETFGKHVLPQFDKDPVHSTTRQREAQVGGAPDPGSRRGRARAAPVADLTRGYSPLHCRRVPGHGPRSGSASRWTMPCWMISGAGSMATAGSSGAS